MRALIGTYFAVIGLLGLGMHQRTNPEIRPVSERAHASAVRAAASQATPQTDAKRTPVVVELFTSEGCSDCPPAEALLAQLDATQPVPGAKVIALEQHVDYWDQMGWRDPFSSSKFSERQNSYAFLFHNASVYTPQMVVDGRAEFVGSHERQARQAIAESAKLAKTDLNVIVPGGSGAPEIPLEIRIEKLSGAEAGDRVEIFLAITESGLHSNVAHGENAGRKLDHMAVVRSLEKIGTGGKNVDTGFSVAAHAKIAPNWKREYVRAVVFIQEHRSHHILGATEIAVR